METKYFLNQDLEHNFINNKRQDMRARDAAPWVDCSVVWTKSWVW